MFRDREDAAKQLAREIKNRHLHAPLVLAIPRGGVVTGAVLAQELGADLDLALASKIRAPGQPELPIGAISEDGHSYLNPETRDLLDVPEDYLVEECRHQMNDIARRRAVLGRGQPHRPPRGRSVIVTDDGIATGSTMIAVLDTVRLQQPRELIVAVPVASLDRLPAVRKCCDEIICLMAPNDFWAIGQYHENFMPVEDDEVVRLLDTSAAAKKGRSASVLQSRFMRPRMNTDRGQGEIGL
jgi:predicted phosphoribosyltransferase